MHARMLALAKTLAVGDRATNMLNRSCDFNIEDSAEQLTPLHDATHANPRGKRGSLVKDAESRDTSETEGTDLLLELHKWVRSAGASPFCAVLGETGQGKTTAMQMFARQLLEQRKLAAAGKKPPLPIYIDLRKYVYEPNDTIESLLKRVLTLQR